MTAATTYGFSRMLEPTNMFRFTCPVFGKEVEARVCFKLHELYMRGEPHEKRPGCNACMSGSKCPTRHMVDEAVKTGKELYYSVEPKVGQLSKDTLERIAPVVVLDRVMDRYGVGSAERNAIAGNVTPLPDFGYVEPTESKPKRKTAAAPDDETVAAAKSGDMSAAISKATSAPPAAKPPVITKTTSATPPAKGMSLLELARQKKAS